MTQNGMNNLLLSSVQISNWQLCEQFNDLMTDSDAHDITEVKDSSEVPIGAVVFSSYIQIQD